MSAASQAGALVMATAALAEAIRDLGSVPSGNLYARVMSHVSIEQYDWAIERLKGAGLVAEKAHELLVGRSGKPRRGREVSAALDLGVVRLTPAERAVLARVRAYATPCPLLLTARGADADMLVAKGMLVLRWTSSDRAFGYYGLTALGDEVARVSGAS